MSGTTQVCLDAGGTRERVVGVALGLFWLTLRDRNAGARRQRHRQVTAASSPRRHRRPSARAAARSPRASAAWATAERRRSPPTWAGH